MGVLNFVNLRTTENAYIVFGNATNYWTGGVYRNNRWQNRFGTDLNRVEYLQGISNTDTIYELLLLYLRS